MKVEYVLELFDSSATWGPNTKLAEVWDARNLGWSRYDRLSGKAFATIPQTSAFLSSIVPLKTHVRMTRIANGTDTEVFNGILVDYDSTGDDIILDIIDYLGLLSASRCGYKTMYSSQAVGTWIVSPEWLLAKNATGSRLGFVATGTIEDPLANDGTTKIKTNATFGVTDQMRLQLFYDLSEMSRANTANHVTFEITRTAPFTFNFWKNRGSASSVPLVLNGTVSDYRYIPGWKSYKNDVATLGTTTAGGATEIVSKDTTAITNMGLWQDATSIKTVMGIAGRLTEQDQQKAATERILKKSAQASAAVAAMVVPGSIEPFVGWDVCDTIPVEIVNGIDNLTGTMRVLGARCMYDELGEQFSIIVGTVL